MKTNTCKVSVLCMAYNHEAYLRDALEGFVSQKTDFAYEVLVNDDCSTDSTAAVLREYAERYPEIIRPFYQKENLYQKHISIYDAVFYPNARGEYVALCEGDDYWTDPEKLQRQVDFLDAHPEYSGCAHNSIGHYTKEERPDEILFPETGDRDIPFGELIRGMSHAFHTSSIIARREIAERPPDFRNVALQYGFTDYPFAIWLSMNGKLRFLDRPMSVYRIASNPASWSSNLSRHYDRLKEFVSGEIAMFEALLPHLSGEERLLAEKELHARRFELLYITGDVKTMMTPEYADLFRQQPLKFRMVTALKRAFPHAHRIYRKKKGYKDY